MLRKYHFKKYTNSALFSALFVYAALASVSCSPAARSLFFDIPEPEPESETTTQPEQQIQIQQAGDSAVMPSNINHPADLEENRRRFERSLLTKVARLRCEYRHVWGRILLARAAKTTSGAERGEDIRVVRGLAQKLENEGLPMGHFMAGLLRAGAAHVLGDDAGAVDELRVQVVRLDETQTMLYAAAAKHRLGKLLYGDEGADFIRSSEEWMAGEGIACPDRMIAMLIPGWTHPG